LQKIQSREKVLKTLQHNKATRKMSVKLTTEFNFTDILPTDFSPNIIPPKTPTQTAKREKLHKALVQKSFS